MYDFPSGLPENDVGARYGSILATASSSYDTVGFRFGPSVMQREEGLPPLCSTIALAVLFHEVDPLDQ